MTAWPHLDALWYQASIYRETGEGHLKLADDILAAFFVYCLALRVEGAMWEKLSSRYRWENEEMQKIEPQLDEDDYRHTSESRTARASRSVYRSVIRRARRNRR